MIRLRGSSPLATTTGRALVEFGLLVAALFMLSACSEQSGPIKIHQVGDPLAANRITVNASFLPSEPFLQNWTVVHEVPFILPVTVADVSRIDFELGSRSPWLVRFQNWSGTHTAKPPKTLTVRAARWTLTAHTGRDAPLAASAALEPGIDLVLSGACDHMGCPYEFAQPDRAVDWLSFSLASDDFFGLANDWLRPRDQVKITVSLAVWLSPGGAQEPGAGGADYLSVTFPLASSGTSVLVASRR